MTSVSGPSSRRTITGLCSGRPFTCSSSKRRLLMETRPAPRASTGGTWRNQDGDEDERIMPVCQRSKRHLLGITSVMSDRKRISSGNTRWSFTVNPAVLLSDPRGFRRVSVANRRATIDRLCSCRRRHKWHRKYCSTRTIRVVRYPATVFVLVLIRYHAVRLSSSSAVAAYRSTSAAAAELTQIHSWRRRRQIPPECH